MIAAKGKFKNGVIQLLEKVDARDGDEVLVMFQNADGENREGLSGEEFSKLLGIVSVGGDALEDTEALYD